MLEVGGKKVRGRLYPWGVVEVENSEHCDFTKLRNMLIRTHMQDLKDVTQDVHYENFRLNRLKKTSGVREREVLSPDGLSESDRKLAEKEAELEKMRQMMAMMQQKLQQQHHV